MHKLQMHAPDGEALGPLYNLNMERNFGFEILQNQCNVEVLSAASALSECLVVVSRGGN